MYWGRLSIGRKCISIPMALSWLILWILWTLVIVGVVIMPWSNFVGHSHWGSVRWIPFQDASLSHRYLFDMAANAFLFVPFGYLFVRSQACVRNALVLWVTILAVVLSAGAEASQVFTHNRIASMTDVTTNVIGAGVGAALAMKLRECWCPTH